MDEILRSMEGSSKAKPRQDLFNNILTEIEQPIAKTIPLKRVILSVCAVAVINLIAFFLLWQYSNSNQEEVQYIASNDVELISNYNIYN